MSVMDSFINALKFKPDDESYGGYDDGDDIDGDYEDYEESRPSRKVSLFRQQRDGYDEEPERPRRGSRQGRTSIPASEIAPSSSRSSRKPLPSAGMEVCVIKPTSIDDAKEVTETLLANRTVVLNLEGLDFAIAQRILDFTSGSCYAIHGNLENISRYIFVITPSAVDISGDVSEALPLSESSAFSAGAGAGSLDVPLGGD